MVRQYCINGETLVRVKGNVNTIMPFATDLGLAEKEVRIVPRFAHQDLFIDDFGQEVPAEVLTFLAEVTIRMTLIHYDPDVLDACIEESLGGSSFGTLVGAGIPLGGGMPLFEAGNHYISVNLLSPVLDRPWRFPTCYLAREPLEIPLGTGTSKVRLEWRCVPYGSYVSPNLEVVSAGTDLFDRNLDS